MVAVDVSVGGTKVLELYALGLSDARQVVPGLHRVQGAPLITYRKRSAGS